MAKKQTKKVEETIPVKPKRVIKPKPKAKPVELNVNELMVEIKVYKDLLTSSLNEIEIKQKNIDALSKVIAQRESAELIAFDENSKELEQLKEKVKSITAFIKYYKEILSTKYGPTTVNITFSLIMFVIFGMSILIAFGFKSMIGDTTSISLVSIVSVCSSAIGYFLYLVNWKK